MSKLIQLIIQRVKNDKFFLIVYLVLIPIVIMIAVYFTNSVSYNMQIGVVGSMKTTANEHIQYIELDQVPQTSELVLNRYDAILVQVGNETEVISTKGEEYNQALLMMTSGQIDSLPTDGTQRQTASNIIGFLMMVVLLLGGQMYLLYFDERKGINKRILGTPITPCQYMLSHFIVVLGFLFIPVVIIICVALVAFNITLSIALWKFILILFLLCFFSASFGVWAASLARKQEDILMYGNMFAILGSIVSGSFVQVTNNEIFNTITQIFPQKQIMSFITALENHTTLPYMGIIYVIGLSCVLLCLGIIIEKKKISTR